MRRPSGLKATLVTQTVCPFRVKRSAWHRRHRMPARATIEQRVAWHLEHQRHCACRPIPKGLHRAVHAGEHALSESASAIRHVPAKPRRR